MLNNGLGYIFLASHRVNCNNTTNFSSKELINNGIAVISLLLSSTYLT